MAMAESKLSGYHTKGAISGGGSMSVSVPSPENTASVGIRESLIDHYVNLQTLKSKIIQFQEKLFPSKNDAPQAADTPPSVDLSIAILECRKLVAQIDATLEDIINRF
jgi:hypothetical protein